MSLRLLTKAYRENALKSNLVSYEGLQKVIGNLLEFFYNSNMSACNHLLPFVNFDISEDFCVHKLFIIKVPESSGHLALIFLVENDFDSVSVIINLK